MAKRPLTEEEIQGLEYDWLGCDGAGAVALFSTAGGGYAPQTFRARSVAYAEVLDRIVALPVNTTSPPPSEVRDAPGIWPAVLARGLFVYDADLFGGPYRRLAVPPLVMSLGDLPSQMASLVGQVRLRHLRFAEAALVSAEDIRLAEGV